MRKRFDDLKCIVLKKLKTLYEINSNVISQINLLPVDCWEYWQNCEENDELPSGD